MLIYSYNREYIKDNFVVMLIRQSQMIKKIIRK